jgi:metal-responsive CopG/Arc/MetJ family transcriptional regulator
MLYATSVAKKLTGIRIKERDLAELEMLAKKEDETISSLIRIAIREYLDRKKKSK